MANRNPRSVGHPVPFSGQGRTTGSLPAVPFDDGAAFGAAAKQFSLLTGQFGDMADAAAAREGFDEGLREARRGDKSQLIAYPDATITTALVDRVIGAESGARTDAKSGTSSARGPGQFLEGTWLDMIGRYRPGLARGKDRAGVLALRTDPELSREMAGRYLEEGAAALHAAGLQASRGNLYLTYFLGAQGAVKMLSAGDDADAGAIAGPDAVAANRAVLEGKSVAQLRAWAGRKMGDTAIEVHPVTPPQLANDGTIRGAAHDKAATAAYQWRLENNLYGDMAAAWEAHKDDPAALARALEGAKAAWMAGGQFGDDPKLAETFERTFETKAATYRLAADERADNKAREARSSEAQELLVRRGEDLQRQAYSLGVSSEGDEALGEQVDRAIASIDNMVENGALSSAQAEKEKRSLRHGVIGARVRGMFDQLPDAAAQEKFAAALIGQWQRGEGPVADLDFRQVSGLADELGNRARGRASANSAEAARRRSEVRRWANDDVASIAASGSGIEIAGKPLAEDDVAAVLGPAETQKWLEQRAQARQLHDAIADFDTLTPEELAGRVKALEPTPGQPGFGQAQRLHQAAAKRAADVMAARKADPAAAADNAYPRVGRLARDTDPASADQLNELVSARLAAQHALGIPESEAQPLTKQEVAGIRTALESNPDTAAALAADYAATLGPDTDRVFAQLSDDAPGLAAAADLAARGGDTEALRRYTRQTALERDPAYKAPARSYAREAALRAETYGGSMLLLPSREAALSDAAGKIFLELARSRGIAADLSDDNPDGKALYGRALQMAAGATWNGNRQIGGIAEVNGTAVLAPVGVGVDVMGQALAMMTGADLEALGAPGSVNGVPVMARDIRNARLVAVGDGLYRVALGDPRSPDPRYVGTQDLGDFWTLDMRQLIALTAPRLAEAADPMAGRRVP